MTNYFYIEETDSAIRLQQTQDILEVPADCEIIAESEIATYFPLYNKDPDEAADKYQHEIQFGKFQGCYYGSYEISANVLVKKDQLHTSLVDAATSRNLHGLSNIATYPSIMTSAFVSVPIYFTDDWKLFDDCLYNITQSNRGSRHYETRRHICGNEKLMQKLNEQTLRQLYSDITNKFGKVDITVDQFVEQCRLNETRHSANHTYATLKTSNYLLSLGSTGWLGISLSIVRTTDADIKATHDRLTRRWKSQIKSGLSNPMSEIVDQLLHPKLGISNYTLFRPMYETREYRREFLKDLHKLGIYNLYSEIRKAVRKINLDAVALPELNTDNVNTDYEAEDQMVLGNPVEFEKLRARVQKSFKPVTKSQLRKEFFKQLRTKLSLNKPKK